MMRKSQHNLDFEIYPISPRRRSDGVSGAKYWIGVELPCELSGLSMIQLTALRKMVMKAFNDGRKSA